ncbi:para-aminobenzoate synthase, (PABA) [Rhodotorula kratochvilovae]
MAPQSSAATSKRRLPTVLVLDFWDSYTANLLRLVHQIAHPDPQVPGDAAAAVEWDCAEWQDRVAVVNVDSLSWDSFEHDILPHVDCVVLGPGPGTPHRQSDFSWPTRLLELLGDRVPIFGLCLGCQGLATVFGGSVVKAAAPKHGQISAIDHSCASCVSNTLFTGVPTPFEAVQYNSLVVDPSSLPAELEAIAWTDAANGEREIMALQHRTKPLWGVQFHPESISSTYGARILSNFLHMARAFHGREDCTPNLPPHVLELSTTHRPQSLPAPALDAPRWEQRMVELEAAEEWTPQRVFERLVKGRGELGEVWLDSARPTGTPQFSHLFSPQATYSYTLSADTLTIQTSASSSRALALPASSTFFTLLGRAQSLLQRATRITHSVAAAASPSPLGFVGHVGYEMKDVTLPLSRPRAPRSTDDTEQPGAVLAFAGCVLSFAHESGKWSASALLRVEGGDGLGDDEAAPLVEHVGMHEEEWRVWVAGVRKALAAPPDNAASPPPVPLPADFAPDQSREEYIASIERARESIIAGDAYELCLTTQFRASLPPSSPLVSDPYPLYLTLRVSNPAPYAAYFHLPLCDTALLSTSPERFLRIDASGRACMKPIKGTARRALDDPVEDARRKDALEGDAKERAENLMIVDLIRNDLLKSCEAESVEVEALMQIETYQTVHQLVTTVVGQLGEGVNPLEAMAKAFPPGSMTGAPKLRSLQLLDELERHIPRGVYSGVFGYLAVDGSSDWAVVIRTLVKRGRELVLGAGGAITHLSDAAKEWDEVLTKVDAVLNRSV